MCEIDSKGEKWRKWRGLEIFEDHKRCPPGVVCKGDLVDVQPSLDVKALLAFAVISFILASLECRRSS